MKNSLEWKGEFNGTIKPYLHNCNNFFQSKSTVNACSGLQKANWKYAVPLQGFLDILDECACFVRCPMNGVP